MEHISEILPGLLVKLWDKSAPRLDQKTLGEYLRSDDPLLQALARREIKSRAERN